MITHDMPLPRCVEPADWVGRAGSRLDWVSGVPDGPIHRSFHRPERTLSQWILSFGSAWKRKPRNTRC